MVRLIAAAAIFSTVFNGPASTGPNLKDLVEAPSLSSPAISPDGRWVAFRRDEASLEINRHDVSWWVAPVDGSKPAKRIADGGEALFNDAGALPSAPPTWSARSDSVYFLALTTDGVQVVRADLDGAARPVTASPGDITTFVLGADGAIVYAAAAPRSEILAAEMKSRDEGVLVDETVDPAQNLFGAIRISGRPAAQRLSGRWFSRRGLLGERDLTFWRADGRHAPAAISVETAQASGMALDTSRKPVFGRPSLVARNEHGAVARVGVAGDAIVVTDSAGAKITCPISVCGAGRITQLSWRLGGNDLVFISKTEVDGRILRTWRVGEGAARTLFLTEGLLHGGGQVGSPCAVGDRFMVCVLASAVTPPHLVAIDLDSGRARDLTRADPDPGVVHHRLQWTDATGRRFLGDLLEPANAPERRPLFVTYYSCDGYLRGGVGDEWPLSALARSGISALCISAPPEQPGEQDGNLKANETAMAGIASAIELLNAQGRIDPNRIGVGGVSFGADVAMWAAMRLPIAAVSIGSLQLEPTYWWFNSIRGRDAPKLIQQSWGLGSPEATPERWKLLSPALNVDKINAPVLMQLPEQEFRSTMQLYARLSQSSVPTELFAFPTEPHILTEPRHRLAAYERNVDWFRFWLQGVEDPSTTKTAQYRRWRAARAAWKPSDLNPSATKP